MPRNIELKARYADLSAAGGIVESLGAVLESTERQIDTYFHTHQGRLKLRERELLHPTKDLPAAHAAELIYYERHDESQPRGSNYERIELHEADAMKRSLERACGLRIAVEKRRTVYVCDRVRIHLDQVTGVGSFIEVEAIVDSTCDDVAAAAKVDKLMAALGIDKAEIIAVSYADLCCQVHGGPESDCR